MTFHHGDLGRAFEMSAVCYGICTACKYTAVIFFFGQFDQFFADLATECITHNEKVSAFKTDVFAYGEVEVIVGDDEVARV